MHWITKPQPLTHGVSALKQHTRPAREVSASSFSTSKIPKVSDRSSPSSVTEVFVTLSNMIVFSSKWTEITVPNHPHRVVPTRTSIPNALVSPYGKGHSGRTESHLSFSSGSYKWKMCLSISRLSRNTSKRNG